MDFSNTQIMLGIEPKKPPVDKVIGALLGAAIGDALGWPQERSSLRLNKFYPSSTKEITTNYISWCKRLGGRYFGYEELVNKGEFSDDTQLILASLRSLLHGDDWIQYFRYEELPIWLLYERGSGNATKRSAESWSKGIPPWNEEKIGIEVAKTYFNAGGNGVAMRILPHALIPGQTEDSLYKQVLLNGISTHGHPRALLGALVYAKALWISINIQENLKLGALIEELIETEHAWSKIPTLDESFQKWLSISNKHLTIPYVEEWNNTVREIIDGLQICNNAIRKGALAVDFETLEKIGCFNPKFNGAGTVTALAAIYLSSRYAADPKTGMLEAAFARGADTDTIASMYGGLLGSLLGVEWIRPEWKAIQDYDYVCKSAQKLNDLVFSEPVSLRKRVKPWTTKDNRLVLSQLRNNVQEKVDLRSLGIAKVIDVIERKPLARNMTAKSWKLLTEFGQTLYINKINKILQPDFIPMPESTTQQPKRPESSQLATANFLHELSSILPHQLSAYAALRVSAYLINLLFQEKTKLGKQEARLKFKDNEYLTGLFKSIPLSIKEEIEPGLGLSISRKIANYFLTTDPD